ncbi:probable sucrose-phosphate synthase 1 isoform X2 [Papaver somniferum]|nr:probable sucrose-phosphate synthase 1 isoform X2 [Papaver somniferum]
MSEDFSEGETDDYASDISTDESRDGKVPGTGDAIVTINTWDGNHQKENTLYVVLVSLHGLIRGENMELGCDSDTGGQVKYVVELARALATMPGVCRVDLLTRQVLAPNVDWSYGEPAEMLPPRGSEEFMHDKGDSSGAYIVRIPFAPRDKYIPKELLWPHIPEFVDGALKHIVQMSKILGEHIGRGEPVWPIAIHGHYADAGDSAALLSGALNVPMIFTGHSLGRDKLEQAMKKGCLSRKELNATYKIMRRIEAEELSLDASEIVITSTMQEVEKQWSLYDGFDVQLEHKLRNVTCDGKYMPRMFVIPPGMEFNHMALPEGVINGEPRLNEASSDPPIWSEIKRFLTNPHKPMILALARPDPKKNITTLVKAFGECRQLRELANLTLIMGNREGIDEMPGYNASVLVSVLKLIDNYDLYGHIAYPKHHKQPDVPDIYRLAAKTKGVFINPAYIEPFGLTLIEAAAHGLPIVATINGGPVDIHRVLDNGILVNPHNQHAIADALLELITNKQRWEKCRQNGLDRIHHFSWPEHCKTYLSHIANYRPRHPQWQRNNEFDDSREIHKKMDEVVGYLDNAVESIEHPTNNSKSRNFGDTTGKFPALRLRKHIFVIAVDYDDNADIVRMIKNVFEATVEEKASGAVGFILSTALTISEINSCLVYGGLSATDFDAYICNSGGDLYYPSSENDNHFGLPFVLDSDYHSQIKYRWGGECLRKALVHWAANIAGKEGGNGKSFVINEDTQRSTTYCHSFKVENPSLIPPFSEIRKLMRIKALRGHVIYCHNGTKLHVIPVLASRAQALRYLYIRWGTELTNMVVIVGECGDTDYEGLLGGVHKTVVLNGVCRKARTVLHSNRNYPLEDVIAYDNPNIVHTGEGCSSTDIKTALGKLGVITTLAIRPGLQLH